MAGGPHRGSGLLGIEQAIHTRLVIGRLEERAEVRDDRRLGRLGEIAVAPERLNDRRGIGGPPVGKISPGEQDLAVVRDRRAAAERLDDGRGVGLLALQRLLEAQPDETLVRPIGDALLQCCDARRWHAGVSAGRDQPVDELDVDLVRQGVGGRHGIRRVVLVEIGDGKLQPAAAGGRAWRWSYRRQVLRQVRPHRCRLGRIAVLGRLLLSGIAGSDQRADRVGAGRRVAGARRGGDGGSFLGRNDSRGGAMLRAEDRQGGNPGRGRCRCGSCRGGLRLRRLLGVTGGGDGRGGQGERQRARNKSEMPPSGPPAHLAGQSGCHRPVGPFDPGRRSISSIAGAPIRPLPIAEASCRS